MNMIRKLFVLLSFPYILLAQETEKGLSFFDEMMHMFLILGGILVAMLVVAWSLKRLLNTRMEQINADSQIKIIEKRHLSPKSILYLVELQGKRYLLGEGPQGVVSLGDVKLPPQKRSFQDVMNGEEQNN